MARARRRVLPLAVGLVLAGLPGAAAAEPFFDLFTGASDTSRADVHVKQSKAGNDFTIHSLSFGDKSFEDPPYYGLRLGYFFEAVPWLGVSLEFFHFKILGETSEPRDISGTRAGAPISTTARVDSVVQRFNITHGVNYLMADVMVRHGLWKEPEDYPAGRVQLYAGAGVGPVIAHAETTIEGVKREPGYEVGGVGVQGFAGVRVLVFKYLGLFAEGKITHSSLTVGVARGGEARLDETSRHIVVGLTAVWP
jgi:lipid A oxidase